MSSEKKMPGAPQSTVSNTHAPVEGSHASLVHRLASSQTIVGVDTQEPETQASAVQASLSVHVRVSSADRVVVSQPNRADGQVPKEGDKIELGWPRQAAVVFPDGGTVA